MRSLEAEAKTRPSELRSRNMAAVKRTDTKPEVALRSALHAVGYRFRKDLPIRLEGSLVRPDIVFTRVRVAVFLDGCFWHMCPDHGAVPATNVSFWRAKLEGNADRDRRQSRLLADDGWAVVRIWEHVPLHEAILTVRVAIARRRPGHA